MLDVLPRISFFSWRRFWGKPSMTKTNSVILNLIQDPCLAHLFAIAMFDVMGHTFFSLSGDSGSSPGTKYNGHPEFE